MLWYLTQYPKHSVLLSLFHRIADHRPSITRIFCTTNRQGRVADRAPQEISSSCQQRSEPCHYRDHPRKWKPCPRQQLGAAVKAMTRIHHHSRRQTPCRYYAPLPTWAKCQRHDACVRCHERMTMAPHYYYQNGWVDILGAQMRWAKTGKLAAGSVYALNTSFFLVFLRICCLPDTRTNANVWNLGWQRRLEPKAPAENV